MNKNYYNISYSRLVLLLLPTLLRQNLIVALVTALVRPLSLIHREFMRFKANLQTPVHSQVCYMEAMLNNLFDFYQRRIYIRDSEVDFDSCFLYNEGSGDVRLISDMGEGDSVVWYDEVDSGRGEVDFEVVFPEGYSFSDSDQKRIKRLINENKLASTKYRLIYG